MPRALATIKRLGVAAGDLFTRSERAVTCKVASGGIMSKTLLLADDSVTIQKVVGISFANEDVVLVTVDNGDDAIAKARETRPDIVLADVVMPGKNGYEVCEAIKADPELAHVPVLLLTGTFEAFDEARASAAGADGHITKPFEAQALVDTVNARLAEAPAAPASITDAPTPSEEPFDFLEDAGTEPSGLSATEAPRTTMIMTEDLGSSDEAFSFDAAAGGDDPLLSDSDSRAETLAGFDPLAEEPDSARTQLVMATDELANAETLPPSEDPPSAQPAVAAAEPGAGHFDDADANEATRVVFEPDVPALEADDSDFGAPLDLDSEAAGSATIEPGIDPLADSAADHEGVLDPEGAEDYDVSSSDLGDSFAEAAEPDPGRFSDPTAAETALAEPVFSAPLDPEPISGQQADAPEPLLVAETIEEAAEPMLEPVLAPAENEATAPAPSERALPDPIEVDSGSSGPDLSPLMREQLHDALEKVAWEAFGDVAERIVQDALARVEEVAWEVIPKMAEALIQEEIRKMKGSDD